jgi:hypothetical protein
VVVDDDDSTCLDDDEGDRKQQAPSLHDKVESTNLPVNEDSKCLHSNREMGIHHDNGEAVSLHGKSNYHRYPQQQGVHSMTSWDTGIEEEEDEGKDNVEANSADNVYGDDDEQRP